MERKLGHFGFADLYAGTRRFPDAVDELIDWSRIEQNSDVPGRRIRESKPTLICACLRFLQHGQNQR
jgi:hypothetical protein